MLAVNLGSMDVLTSLVLSPCRALVSHGLQSPLTCLSRAKGRRGEKGGSRNSLSLGWRDWRGWRGWRGHELILLNHYFKTKVDLPRSNVTENIS